MITSRTFGYVYIIHFARPLGNLSNRRAQAQHYTGFAIDPIRRFAEHRAGLGARITQAAVRQGIALELVVCVQAPQAAEYDLKRRIKKAPRFCPICCAAHGWRCREPEFDKAALALPAVEEVADDWDFPTIRPERDRPDWLEVQWSRSFLRATHFDLGPDYGPSEVDIPY